MSDEVELFSQGEVEQIADVHFLAQELAKSYAEYVAFQMVHNKHTLKEARAEADNVPDHMIKHSLEQPAKQVDWWHLRELQGRDPELAIRRWQSIKADAAADVASGSYLINSLVEGSPYQRAIFMAVRVAFTEQWQPRNVGEQLLVDTLAQTYTTYLRWLNRLELRTTLDAEFEDGRVNESGKWAPSFHQGTSTEWIETTATMVERFHRLFLRTMRALRDLRRWNINVTIPNAGQVNIGERQINTQQTKGEDRE